MASQQRQTRAGVRVSNKGERGDIRERDRKGRSLATTTSDEAKGEGAFEGEQGPLIFLFIYFYVIHLGKPIFFGLFLEGIIVFIFPILCMIL